MKKAMIAVLALATMIGMASTAALAEDANLSGQGMIIPDTNQAEAPAKAAVKEMKDETLQETKIRDSSAKAYDSTSAAPTSCDPSDDKTYEHCLAVLNGRAPADSAKMKAAAPALQQLRALDAAEPATP